MNALSFDKTPEAYRYPSIEAARDDLQRRHRATDELEREVEHLLVIFNALAMGAHEMSDERVDPEAFVYVAERLERAFRAVQESRTREWPCLCIVKDNDLMSVEHKPGAAWGVDRLDGKHEPVTA